MKKVVWGILSTARIGREKVIPAMQAAQLREVAAQVHIMEAFMVRFHPQWARVRAQVRSGELGAVRSIQTHGLQGDAFSRAIRTQSPLPWGIDDAIANMRVIDALFASEKSGAWVAP